MPLASQEQQDKVLPVYKEPQENRVQQVPQVPPVLAPQVPQVQQEDPEPLVSQEPQV